MYDAGCARHYYWCPRTDEVSWLPPRHPLAVIGDAAPKIAKGICLVQEEQVSYYFIEIFYEVVGAIGSTIL